MKFYLCAQNIGFLELFIFPRRVVVKRMRVGKLDHSAKLNRSAQIVRFALRIQEESNQFSILLPHFHQISTLVRLLLDRIHNFMINNQFFLDSSSDEDQLMTCNCQLKSICKYESGKNFFSSNKSTSYLVTLNEKFTRPATVTGAYLFPSGEIIFHQMTLDRIENDEYVLQNTDLVNHSPGKLSIFQKQIQYFSKVIRIFLKHPYYASFEYISHLHNETQSNVYEDADMKLKFVNEKFGNMEKETWYLLPEAYTLHLIPDESIPTETSDSRESETLNNNDSETTEDDLVNQFQAVKFH